MFSIKYKLPKFFLHLAAGASLMLSFLSLTPIVVQPAYAVVTNKCATYQKEACGCTGRNLNTENCGIIYYFWLIINIMSGLAALALVASLVVAGIQWTTAGDNPQQITAAKARITNVLIAALALIFMYSLLQWLVPGGIF